MSACPEPEPDDCVFDVFDTHWAGPLTRDGRPVWCGHPFGGQLSYAAYQAEARRVRRELRLMALGGELEGGEEAEAEAYLMHLFDAVRVADEASEPEPMEEEPLRLRGGASPVWSASPKGAGRSTLQGEVEVAQAAQAARHTALLLEEEAGAEEAGAEEAEAEEAEAVLLGVVDDVFKGTILPAVVRATEEWLLTTVPLVDAHAKALAATPRVDSEVLKTRTQLRACKSFCPLRGVPFEATNKNNPFLGRDWTWKQLEYLQVHGAWRGVEQRLKKYGNSATDNTASDSTEIRRLLKLAAERKLPTEVQRRLAQHVRSGEDPTFHNVLCHIDEETQVLLGYKAKAQPAVVAVPVHTAAAVSDYMTIATRIGFPRPDPQMGTPHTEEVLRACMVLVVHGNTGPSRLGVTNGVDIDVHDTIARLCEAHVTDTTSDDQRPRVKMVQRLYTFCRSAWPSLPAYTERQIDWRLRSARAEGVVNWVPNHTARGNKAVSESTREYWKKMNQDYHDALPFVWNDASRQYTERTVDVLSLPFSPGEVFYMLQKGGESAFDFSDQPRSSAPAAVFGPDDCAHLDVAVAVQRLATASKGKKVVSPRQFRQEILPLIKSNDLYLLIGLDLQLAYDLACCKDMEQRREVKHRIGLLKERKDAYTKLSSQVQRSRLQAECSVTLHSASRVWEIQAGRVIPASATESRTRSVSAATASWDSIRYISQKSAASAMELADVPDRNTRVRAMVEEPAGTEERLRTKVVQKMREGSNVEIRHTPSFAVAELETSVALDGCDVTTTIDTDIAAHTTEYVYEPDLTGIAIVKTADEIGRYRWVVLLLFDSPCVSSA